jgi:antitoxin HicB
MLKEDNVSEYGYRVIYEPIAEGGYHVIVPALPGIITYGRTFEEAREMARDAIVCHLRGLIKDQEEIPDDAYVEQQQPLAEDIKVAV